MHVVPGRVAVWRGVPAARVVACVVARGVVGGRVMARVAGRARGVDVDVVGVVVLLLRGFHPPLESCSRGLGLEYGVLHVGAQLGDKGVEGQSTGTAEDLDRESDENANNDHPCWTY